MWDLAGHPNQIIFAYDMVVPAPIGKFRAAVLMEFTDLLISKIVVKINPAKA
jgi:hypothetical protein